MKIPRALPASCFCIGVALSGVSLAVSAQAQQSTQMPVEHMDTMSSTSSDAGTAHWIPDNGEAGGHVTINTANPKTRTQILQELQEAKADPAWATRQGEDTGHVTTYMTNSETRAHVLQGLQEARTDRTWTARQGEEAGY